MTNKDMLFFSNFCEHCKDVINLITKKNIRDNFMFVCIDNGKFKIPTCITHVPSIITHKKDVLTDAYVLAYIDKLVNSTTNNNDDISPFSLAQSGYSSSYTWLTDNGYDNDGKVSLNNEGAVKSNYVMLGAESHIFIPKEDDSSSSKANKFDDSTYEKFINSRNLDEDIIKKSMAGQQQQRI
jgi:hypothetical protein